MSLTSRQSYFELLQYCINIHSQKHQLDLNQKRRYNLKSILEKKSDKLSKMLNSSISSYMTMGWQPVDEKIHTKMMNGCSTFNHTSKPVKRVKKRTLRLNCELKKFARLKSYSQYVKTKTMILRDISDNEDTEDEMYNSDKDDDVFSKSQCPRVDGCAMFLSIEQSNPKPKTTRTSYDNAEMTNVQKKSRNKKKSYDCGVDRRSDNEEDIDIESDHQQDRGHKSRTNARKNLTTLLENFHANIADPIMDVVQSTQMVESHWDYANNSSSNNNNNNNNDGDDGNDGDDDDDNNNNNNNNNNNDSDSDSNDNSGTDDDDNVNDDRKPRDITNRESLSSYSQMPNSQSIRLSIDDDTQNNVSIDNQTHDSKVLDDGDKSIVTRAISTSNNEIEMKYEEGEEPSVVADEEQKQKLQPTITSTAIVKSRYMIIRDENEKEEPRRVPVDNRSEIETQDEESIKLDGPSSESRRLGQLKRINLMSSSSSSSDTESDSNQAKDETKYAEGTHFLQSSRIISEFSDSDESIESIESPERSQDIVDNGQSSQRSNDDDGIRRNNVATAAEKRSIKCQIEEQESGGNGEPLDKFQSNSTTLDSSLTKTNKILATKSDDSPIKKKRRLIGDGRTIKAATDPHSPSRYVSNDVSTRSINEDLLLDNTNNNNNTSTEANINKTECDGELDETIRRPIELMHFITRQGLSATPKLSTIAIDQVAIGGKKDQEDEIWLLEIPKMIARDHQLLGQSLSLERTTMRIGQATYDIIRKYDKSVSVILPIENKEKARYKIANISPVGSIQLTRCESSNETISTQDRQNREEKEEVKHDEEQFVNRGNIVAPPRFPNNLKSRNPLMSTTGENGNGSNNYKSKKTRKAKNHHGVWHIGNFISKSNKQIGDTSPLFAPTK